MSAKLITDAVVDVVEISYELDDIALSLSQRYPNDDLASLLCRITALNCDALSETENACHAAKLAPGNVRAHVINVGKCLDRVKELTEE